MVFCLFAGTEVAQLTNEKLQNLSNLMRGWSSLYRNVMKFSCSEFSCKSDALWQLVITFSNFFTETKTKWGNRKTRRCPLLPVTCTSRKKQTLHTWLQGCAEKCFLKAQISHAKFLECYWYNLSHMFLDLLCTCECQQHLTTGKLHHHAKFNCARILNLHT